MESCGTRDYVCECILDKDHKTPHACTCGRAWFGEKDFFCSEFGGKWTKEQLEDRFNAALFDSFKSLTEDLFK